MSVSICYRAMGLNLRRSEDASKVFSDFLPSTQSDFASHPAPCSSRNSLHSLSVEKFNWAVRKFSGRWKCALAKDTKYSILILARKTFIKSRLMNGAASCILKYLL
eukprot:GHVO01017764.1.p2 GENE.GHVO01017764.1~~GHVO01017764.1.p2  ORF type:complete len:106 (-),score=1.44 GHVO01017764.1:130-447(-)